MQKKILIFSFLYLLLIRSYAQPPELSILDSIATGPAPASHFAGLYHDFLTLVEEKLETADSSTRRLVRHFESVFAEFYIDAALAHRDGRPIELAAWKAYFENPGLSRVQYYLLGANAHLNGGLAEAIANSYTPGEWKMLKKEYVLFNSCLNETLDYVLEETLKESGRARVLSILSLGLVKPASRFYLYKWRKRQMRVTEYAFAGDGRFEKLARKIERKKKRIDRLIIQNI